MAKKSVSEKSKSTKNNITKRKIKPKKSEDIIDVKLIDKETQLEDNIIRKIKHYFHLHLDNYSSSHGRKIEGTLFLLNFIAIILFVIETYNPAEIFRPWLTGLEIFIVSIFIIEYSARMWVAEKKIKHFFSIYSIIDLLSILPILIHFANLSFFRIFRILRLFRMIRILRFQRMFKAKDTLFGKLSDTQLIIIRIVLIVFTIIFVSSGLIWTVENKINPGQLSTITDAMYFSIVTLSTVGYGDVTPLSSLGKIITVIMILSGIALIPWQLSKLIRVFFRESMKIEAECPRCGLERHDPDAVYCKKCGTKIKHIIIKKTQHMDL